MQCHDTDDHKNGAKYTAFQQMWHRVDVWRLSNLSSFTDLFNHVNKKIMYVLSWWTIYAFTWVTFLCLFPELQSSSRNKHQNNPLEGEQTVHHSSPYTILYMITYCLIYFQGSRCDLYPPCYCCLTWDVMIYRTITMMQNIQHFIVSLFNASIHNHTMIILHIIFTTDVHGKWNNTINLLFITYHWLDKGDNFNVIISPQKTLHMSLIVLVLFGVMD